VYLFESFPKAAHWRRSMAKPCGAVAAVSERYKHRLVSRTSTQRTESVAKGIQRFVSLHDYPGNCVWLGGEFKIFDFK